MSGFINTFWHSCWWVSYTFTGTKLNLVYSNQVYFLASFVLESAYRSLDGFLHSSKWCLLVGRQYTMLAYVPLISLYVYFVCLQWRLFLLDVFSVFGMSSVPSVYLNRSNSSVWSTTLWKLWYISGMCWALF